MRPSMHTPRGFTLLEAMTAVAILGVASTLAVVGYQKMIDGRRETSAAHAVYGAVVKARQQARLTGQPTRLVVLTDAQNLRTVRWERPACEATGFEPACPTTACRTGVCGSEGCVCDAMGEPIPVPARLDLGALASTGLCFVGPDASPRPRSCTGTTPVTELRLWPQGAPDDVVIELEPLSGLPRLRSLPHPTSTPPAPPGDGPAEG